MTLVECFDRKTNTCRLDGYCRLKDSLYKAMQGFFDVLDGITLADLLAPMAAGKGPAGQLPHLIPIQFASLARPKKALPAGTQVARPAKPAATRKPKQVKAG
jgi:Rrf2 family nitric oxide-sensitive transcriptional repressor